MATPPPHQKPKNTKARLLQKTASVYHIVGLLEVVLIRPAAPRVIFNEAQAWTVAILMDEIAVVWGKRGGREREEWWRWCAYSST